jgi:hypothetical protein
VAREVTSLAREGTLRQSTSIHGILRAPRPLSPVDGERRHLIMPSMHKHLPFLLACLSLTGCDATVAPGDLPSYFRAHVESNDLSFDIDGKAHLIGEGGSDWAIFAADPPDDWEVAVTLTDRQTARQVSFTEHDGSGLGMFVSYHKPEELNPDVIVLQVAQSGVINLTSMGNERGDYVEGTFDDVIADDEEHGVHTVLTEGAFRVQVRY